MLARTLPIKTQPANTSEEISTNRISRRVRLFPIFFFILYLSLTVVFFAFGPWPYPVTDGTNLYTFLASAHLALLAGYLSVAFRSPRGYSGRWGVKRITTVSLIVNLALLLPTAKFYTGSFFPDVTGGLANPGEAYIASRIVRQETTSLIGYVRVLTGPLLSMLLPLTVFYWRQLNPRIRGLAVFSILGVVAIFVAMGTNKAIADTVLLVPWLLLAGHLSAVSRLRWSRKAIVIVGSIVAFVLFLSFYATTMSARVGSSFVSGYFVPIGRFADEDNFMLRYLPIEAQIGVLSLTNNLSHGYYALYLSLKEPFIPMFGVGNSMFLYRQAARITGIDEILDLPYPVRIEKYGWNAYGLWSSIYPWIASDMSFPGTIFVVFLIGRLFAYSWLDTVKGDNPFAVAMLAQFLIMLFYFPANNQCLQSGEGFTAFWGILLLWLFTRRRYG